MKNNKLTSYLEETIDLKIDQLLDYYLQPSYLREDICLSLSSAIKGISFKHRLELIDLPLQKEVLKGIVLHKMTEKMTSLFREDLQNLLNGKDVDSILSVFEKDIGLYKQKRVKTAAKKEALLLAKKKVRAKAALKGKFTKSLSPAQRKLYAAAYGK